MNSYDFFLMLEVVLADMALAERNILPVERSIRFLTIGDIVSCVPIKSRSFNLEILFLSVIEKAFII